MFWFTAIRLVMEVHPEMKLVYPVHPNPKVQRSAQDAFGNCSNILLLPPQEFASFRQLEQSCYLCLTDSGGVQEECSALGKPALVLRDFTERPEGIAQGPLALIGTKENDVYSSFTKYLDAKEEYAKLCQQTNIYGDGHAS